LQGWESPGPLGVGGIETLVDDGGALSGFDGCVAVGDIDRPRGDSIGQRRRPVPRDDADGLALTGKMGDKGAANLSGTEDDVLS